MVIIMCFYLHYVFIVYIIHEVVILSMQTPVSAWFFNLKKELSTSGLSYRIQIRHHSSSQSRSYFLTHQRSCSFFSKKRNSARSFFYLSVLFLEMRLVKQKASSLRTLRKGVQRISSKVYGFEFIVLVERPESFPLRVGLLVPSVFSIRNCNLHFPP